MPNATKRCLPYPQSRTGHNTLFPIIHLPTQPIVLCFNGFHSNPLEQLHAPLQLLRADQRPINLRPHPPTPLRAHTDPARRSITRAIVRQAHEPNVAAQRCRATNRTRQIRIRLVALEPVHVEADTAASCLDGARTGLGAVVVAETLELAGGVAGCRGADSVHAGPAGGAYVTAGTTVSVGGAEILTASVAEGDAVAGAEGC